MLRVAAFGGICFDLPSCTQKGMHSDKKNDIQCGKTEPSIICITEKIENYNDQKRQISRN